MNIYVPNPSSCMLFPTEIFEVKDAIVSLKNKGNCLHVINVVTWNNVSDHFAIHLSTLYNIYLRVTRECADYHFQHRDNLWAVGKPSFNSERIQTKVTKLS